MVIPGIQEDNNTEENISLEEKFLPLVGNLVYSSGSIEEQNSLFEAISLGSEENNQYFLQKPVIKNILTKKQQDKANKVAEGTLMDLPSDISVFFQSGDSIDFESDNNEMLFETKDRAKLGHISGVDDIIQMGTSMVQSPFLLRDNIYNQAPENSQKIVLSYGDDPKVSELYKDKADIIDVLTMRNMHVSNISSAQYDLDVEARGGVKQHSDFVLRQGDQFLTDDQRKYQFLQAQYLETKDVAEKEKLKNQLEGFDFGDKLYDPVTGEVLSLDKASPEGKEIKIKAETLAAETTELEDLSIGLSKSYSKLLAVAKDVNNYVSKIGVDNFKNQVSGFTKLTGSVRDLFGADDTLEDDLANLQRISETSEIPATLSLMPGNHPAAKAYNDALKEYLAYNQAVKLNVDPLSTEKDNFFMGAWESILNKVDGKQSLVSKFDAAESFYKAVQGSSKLEFVDQKKADERITEDFLDGRTLGYGTVDLSLFVGELFVAKKATGIDQKMKKFEKVLKASKFYKNNKKTGRLLNLAVSGVAEAGLFVGVEVAKGQTGEELKETAPFGFALGVGNKFAQQVTSRLLKSKYVAPPMQKLNKYYTTSLATEQVIGASTGSTVYHFALAVNDTDYFKDLVLKDQDDPNSYYGEKLIESYLAEFAKLGFLGIGRKAGGATGIFDAVKRDIATFRGRTVESERSAKILGVDHKEIDTLNENAENNINESFNKKLKEAEDKRKNNEITDKEFQVEKSRLELSKLTLENRLSINQFKQQIEAEKTNNRFVDSEAEAARIAEKILAGEDLTPAENTKFSSMNIGYMLNAMGARGKKIMGDQNFKNSFLYSQAKAQAIEEVLNSSNLKTDYKSGERKQVYDHVLKTSKVLDQVNFLKGKEKLSDNEKSKLKELEAEYESLTKGEEFSKINKIVEDYTTNRYEKDIAVAREILVSTKEGKLIESKNVEEFQKQYEEAFPESKINVSERLGFYNPNTRELYINRNVAINQRNITTGKHEVLHFVLRDVLKNEQGKVTQEGIKLIDDVMTKLTPEQKKTVQDRIDANYRYAEDGKEKNKEDYYEEYLTVLSENISNGVISFSENLSKPLTNFIPFMRRKGLENLEIGTETAEQMFNLIKSYSKNEGLGIEAAKAVSEAAKGTTQKGEAPFSKEAPLDAINKLIPDNIKTKTKFNEFIRNEKSALKIAQALDTNGVINNYIRSRQENKEQGDKMLDEVRLRVFNFDPEAKRADGTVVGPEGFGESIFANTRFAKMVASKQLAQESEQRKQQTRITKETEQIIADNKTAKTEATAKPDPLQIKVQDFTGVPKDLSIKSNIKPNLNFGQVSKEYGIEIADQVFGPGVGAKIMKGEKNLVGEPARAVQQYYAKGRNLELSLKTLPDYNVSPKTSKIGLETLDVSMDVQGRSIKLPGRFLDYFMEDFVDPTGVMTTPIGRSKGKSTQPFVKKLKEEFYKVTPELVKKVGKDIGITKPGDPNLIVGAETRTEIGGILKGMAKVDMMKLANIQYRTQRAEQGAGKQELADAAAGKRDAQFSEEKLGKKASIEKLAGGKIEATKNKTKAQVLEEGLDKIINNDPEMGLVMNASSLSPLGKDQRRGALIVSEGSDKITTLKQITSGEIVVNNFQSRAEKKAGKSINAIKKENPDIAIALRGQSKYDLDRNFATREQHIEGNIKLIEKFEKAFKIDPIATQYLLYNQNANFAATKNMAQMIGIELGIDMKFVREEHMLQHGSFVELMFETFSLKGESKKTAQRKLAEFYIQVALEGKQKGLKSSEKIIDGIYVTNRFTGEKAPVFKSQFELHRVFREAWDKGKQTGDWSKLPNPGILRSYNEYFYLNSNKITREGVTDAKRYDVEVDKKFQNRPDVVSKQAELIYLQEIGQMSSKVANKIINEYVNKLAPAKFSIAKKSNKNLPKELRFTEQKSLNDIVRFTEKLDKAISIARNPNAPKKGISVFDFDDTLARTKSKVRYEMPDGTEGVLNATQFAKESSRLEKDGAIFDFSDFNKVIGGKKGPLFELAQKREGKFTNKDIFVLTARPQLSAAPIHMFLKSQGLNIPIENIKGLEDGSPQAKARWIIGKAAEGYNDFYFADDAYKNVKAVQKALNIIDVKSDVQQARFSKTKNLNKDINSIIEYATGIGKEKTYSKAKAEITGKGKKNWSIYMPNRAGDFYSLTNALLGKGKKGLENREWFKENLSKPFSRGDLAYQTERRVKMADYYAIKRQLKDAEYEAGLLNMFRKNPLKKPFEKGSKWTNEHAVRVYNWNKQNILPKDISKSDVKKLVDHVNNNPKLKSFAENLIEINKQDGYPAPKEFWVSEGITQDMLTGGENVSRKRHMKEFIDNANIIFSPENLNKMEAALGPTWRRAMEDAIERMKTGTNRPSWGRGNKWESDILDFMNGSISGIMFLNVRSAILQQVSIPNYINVTDNNPFKAAKAFANFPQFAKDYVKLMNDQWSRNRRDGLRYNIQESEIVEALSRSKNKGAAIIDWALKKGFVLTKYADSHATAFGGASFYRNRLNTYKKKDLSEKEAEERALEDWREMSDATQQTSRMDRVSQEQKSVAGRLILPFSSVQLAYGRRYIDDPARDLINGRYEGLIKGENSALKKVGQIVYGTVLQGALFHALQQGVFKVIFEDGNTLDGEELEVANATLDGILVGMGIRGKAYATFKNWLIKSYQELQKDNPKLRDTTSELLRVSPPIDKKYRQIRGALATLDYDMDEMSEVSLDNPGLAAAAGIIEASTNAPTDRLLRKMQNVKAALEEDRANWQRPFLLGGWAEYDFEEDDRSNNTFRGFTPRRFEKRKFKRRKFERRKIK